MIINNISIYMYYELILNGLLKKVALKYMNKDFILGIGKKHCEINIANTNKSKKKLKNYISIFFKWKLSNV